MPTSMRQWADEIAIRQLLHQYCHRIDNLTAKDVGALWHPEGVLELTFTSQRKQYVGREVLTGWFDEVHKGGRNAKKNCHMRHSIANPVIRFTSPDRANVEVEIWAHDVRDGAARLYAGHYRDEVIQWRDRWWFWIKRIHLTHDEPVSDTRLLRPESMCYFEIGKER